MDKNNYGMLQGAVRGRFSGLVRSWMGSDGQRTAFFVKDVFGPKGSVSIVLAESGAAARSADINTHTRTNQILRHYADMSRPDERIDMSDEPGHDDLCEREQRYLLRAIRENLDLTDHLNDGVKSLAIVLAADESIQSGDVVRI